MATEKFLVPFSMAIGKALPQLMGRIKTAYKIGWRQTGIKSQMSSYWVFPFLLARIMGYTKILYMSTFFLLLLEITTA